MTRIYEAVEAPTRTEEQIRQAKEYWVKKHEENTRALGISAARLAQLGIGIEERICND